MKKYFPRLDTSRIEKHGSTKLPVVILWFLLFLWILRYMKIIIVIIITSNPWFKSLSVRHTFLTDTWKIQWFSLKDRISLPTYLSHRIWNIILAAAKNNRLSAKSLFNRKAFWKLELDLFRYSRPNYETILAMS